MGGKTKNTNNCPGLMEAYQCQDTGRFKCISLSSIALDMQAWQKMYSTDKKDGIVVTWYKETDTYKNGKVDSGYYHDINVVKNGKIDYLGQYKRAPK